MTKRKKNPRWLLPVIVVGSVGVAATVAVLGYWAFKKKEPSALPQTPVTPARPSEPDDSWRADVDLDAAMPTLADFPMGWTAEGPTGRDGAGDNPFRFWARVLELNAMSGDNQWVAVWSGATPTGISHGWIPARTRDEAYALIAEELRQVQT